MSAVKKSKATRQPIIDNKNIDRAVNAVFTAFTQDLGRPFIAGGRNVRSTIRTWCPLLQGDMDVEVRSFNADYVSAHFLDRYFYTTELDQRALEDQALEKFKKNLGRGYMQNQWKLAFLPTGRLNSVLLSASLEIGRILGELDIHHWFELCTHGPNATIGVKKMDAYYPNKVITLDGTLPCIRLYNEYLGWNSNLATYLWPDLISEEIKPTVVAGNRLSFVPKKFDSLRTMMVEPTLNQFFQQGLGGYITEQLSRFGNIELETQPNCHRALCRVISANRLDIATIDWSQASDRIWLGLCQKLLPSDWFAAILDVRSPVTTYNGTAFELTMTGSMGCGFTFPLQTLLFSSLLRALARESGKEQFVSVFGDDCICDSNLVDDITWLAEQLDWQMNADKSFFTGDFRETCGVDSYRGVDCRPFFIERPDDVYSPSGLAAWAYGVYNQSARVIERFGRANHLGMWLVDFFKEYGLGEIFFVPPRFSVQAGVQIKDPAILNPLPNTSSRIIGNDAYGFHFPFLGSKRRKVKVIPEPYYLLALEGKGVPKSFSKGILPSLEDPSLVPDKDCLVPWKGNAYGKRKGYVHTWQYFIE